MINAQVQTSQQSWWPLLFRGIFALIFGLIALIFPGIALFALVFVFGVYALLDGIMAVYIAIKERHMLPRWGWLLAEGIAGIVLGLVAFLWPGETALILLYIVAAWAIVTGVMEIGTAFVGKDWLFGIAGVISIVFGLFLFAFPGAGLLSVLWIVGIYAIVFGILFIVSAFQLRSHQAAGF
jgi:uncharacterized membrane protein HdeD (DUF308 family)